MDDIFRACQRCQNVVLNHRDSHFIRNSLSRRNDHLFIIYSVEITIDRQRTLI